MVIILVCLSVFNFTAFDDIISLFYYFFYLIMYILCFINVSNIQYCISDQFITVTVNHASDYWTNELYRTVG